MSNTGPSSCSQSFPDPKDLRRMTRGVNINNVFTKDQDQSIFPDITFNCNGFITKWIMGAERFNVNSPLHPELSIWRRISSDTYIKIKSSFLQTINETNHTYVYEYSPNPPLEFQEGDILGMYQPSDGNVAVYFQKNTGPLNYVERVTDLSGAPSTFRPIASRHFYPLVSVEILPGIKKLFY